MMSQTLLSLRIIGLHPVIPDTKMFKDALDDFWGGDESETSLAHVKEHFANLYILEIEIDPPNAVFDWAEITQFCLDKLDDYWQVPWDERAIDDVGRRWAFFFHCLDLSRPLRTPIGEIDLPPPTPIPAHLLSLEYQLP